MGQKQNLAQEDLPWETSAAEPPKPIVHSPRLFLWSASCVPGATLSVPPEYLVHTSNLGHLLLNHMASDGPVSIPGHWLLVQEAGPIFTCLFS